MSALLLINNNKRQVTAAFKTGGGGECLPSLTSTTRPQLETTARHAQADHDCALTKQLELVVGGIVL